MADVKWIKIVTDIFDDEKILLIESLPDADAMIVIWFKLLCFAGKQNNDGVFMLNDRIAYTDKMLSTIFRRKESTVQMALKTFEEFGMIEIVNGVITIPNWNKHQTLDAYEKKKQRDRIYQAERRATQRRIVEKSSDSQTTPSCDVAVSDKEKEREKDVNCMVEVYNLGSTNWTNLLAEGMKRHILSPTEMDLLKLAVAYADGKKFPSDKQAKLIWKIREKLDQAGVLI